MPRFLPRTAYVAARVASVLGAAMCTACASATDPATKTSAPMLSAAEASALAAGFVSQAAGASAGGTSTRNSDGSVTFTSPCPLGGTLTDVISSETGSLDADRTGTLTSTSTITPQGCVLGTGARQLAITGDPSLTMRSTLTFAAGVLTVMSETMSGGFKWDGGGCQSNYTATITTTGATRTIAISGTICGRSVNDTRTL